LKETEFYQGNPMASEATQAQQETQDQPALKLSDAAIRQVKNILARDNMPDYGLRVAVVSGGCSGFSYGLDFEKQERPDDVVLSMDGLKIFLDPSSAHHLTGTVIDYVSSLQESGFRFTNPNAKSTCGCGTSFSA
jgi:iron-sulfur cluster assembly accessory protein